MSSRKIKSFAAGLALGAAFLAASGASAMAGDSGTHQLPDMSSHPLAGSEVDIQIRVRDALGQEGRSETIRVTLPQNTFRNPLNPSLAALRKELALDSRKSGAVAEALAVLLQDSPPERQEIGDRLSKIHENLLAAKDVDALEQVIGDLWQVMLLLEEESMTEAEKNLRDAEKRLQEALEKGLSPEELKELTEEMQRAMEEYLKEQAEQEDDPEAQATLEEMRKMMEEMRELQEGMEGMDAEAAQKMLNQMQQMQQQGQSQSQMKKNMQQQMEEMQQQLQEMKEMAERLEALEKIIEKQEDLTADTEQEAERRDSGQANMEKLREEAEGFAKNLRDRAEHWRKLHPEPDRRDAYEEISQQADEIYKDIEEGRQSGRELSEEELEEKMDRLDELQRRYNNSEEEDPHEDNGNSAPQGESGQPEKPDNLHDQMDQLNKSMNRRNLNQKLGDRQGTLRWELNRMVREMKMKGQDTSKLEEALQNMQDALDNIRGDNPDNAVPDQNQALDSLRDAKEQMQQQMQQQMGAGGQGAPELGEYGGELQKSPDPLGHSNPNADMGVDPQQGNHYRREVLDQIRDRLENRHIDPRDREHLERLLQDRGMNRPAP